MSRPKPANDLQVSVLLPSEVVDRRDARAAAKSQEQGLTVTRADILRLVIRRGLEALDAEHPPEGKRRRVGKASGPGSARRSRNAA